MEEILHAMAHGSVGSYLGFIRTGAALALAATILIGLTAAPADAQGRGRKLGHYKNGKAAQHGPITGNGAYGYDGGHQAGATNGYREGFEQGQRDRRDGRRLEYQRHGRYRDADHGYDDDYGARGDYQAAYRSAYARGYQDGYSGRTSDRGHDGYYGHDNGHDGWSGYDPNGHRTDRGRYSRPVYPRQQRGRYDNGGYYGGGYGNQAPYDPRYRSDREGDEDREEVARRAAQQGYYDGYQRGQYDRSSGSRRPNPTGHGAYQYGYNGFDPDWGSGLTYRRYYQQYFVQGYNAGFGQRSFDRRHQRRWW